jgi:hypothetical protein
MRSTASEGFHSGKLSSHILIIRGRSFANEMEGGSGTLCFSKKRDLPFASLSSFTGPGVGAGNVGGRSQGAVACESVIVRGGELSVVVSMAPDPSRAITGLSMAAAEGCVSCVMPAPSPPAMAFISATSWA